MVVFVRLCMYVCVCVFMCAHVRVAIASALGRFCTFLVFVLVLFYGPPKVLFCYCFYGRARAAYPLQGRARQSVPPIR